MLNFFICFIDFLLENVNKTQNNRKLKQKIVKKSIKIFTSLKKIIDKLGKNLSFIFVGLFSRKSKKFDF